MSTPKTRWAPIALWVILLFKVWQGGAFDGTAWRHSANSSATLDQLFTGIACVLFAGLTLVLGLQILRTRCRPAPVRTGANQRRKREEKRAIEPSAPPEEV